MRPTASSPPDPSPAGSPSPLPSATPPRPRIPKRFRLGQILATPAALAALERSGEDPLLFLARHGVGDWGDVGPEDGRLNDAAVAAGDDPALRCRILSAYRTRLGERLWVLTEADRSATTLLLPTEY